MGLYGLGYLVVGERGEWDGGQVWGGVENSRLA